MEEKKKKLEEEIRQNEIALYANALSNPIRVAILYRLNAENCCYHGDLSEELPIAKSTLSQHLKVLKESGLIQGEIDPPKTKYCINRDNWNKARDLISMFFGKASSASMYEI